MRKRVTALLALLLVGLIILTGCGQIQAVKEAAKATEAFAVTTAAPDAAETAITDPQEIADYIFAHGELPPNFITKKEAQALGWRGGDLYAYAPGKSIGGSVFANYEKKLPKVKGRVYRECDANYTGGKRGDDRIVYSNDGHVWFTSDHYETFIELFPSNQ